jgi:alpha-methylacyl-CoA racemase
MAGSRNLPLEGLKIIDLTRLLPGPLCTCLLGDLGAEVTKIEDTQMGDYMRFFPPMAARNSALFVMLNRNKKSVSLDLKNQKAVEIFKKMIADADVLTESFRPGVMEKLGLGYDVLKAINPKLVYCSINGFGHHADYGNKAGHDLNFIGLAGITVKHGHEAVVPPFQLADIVGGAVMAALQIVSASYKAMKSGEGSFINHSIAENLACAFPFSLLESAGLSNDSSFTIVELLTGKTPFYRYYKTSDEKWVAFAPIEHKFWNNFCMAVNKTEWLPLYMQKKEGFEHEISALIAGYDHSFWQKFALENDCCVTPVYEKMQDSPFEMTFTENHPAEGEVLHHRVFGNYGNAVRTPSPQWGENTVEEMQKLGYSESEIQELISQHAVKAYTN